MARFTGKIRRLADLRGLAGRTAGGVKVPHEIYMRLCCLEMERFRREQEQTAAMSRAQKCIERCRTIESEVQELLRSIGQVSLTGAGLGGDGTRAEPAATAADSSKLMFTY